MKNLSLLVLAMLLCLSISSCDSTKEEKGTTEEETVEATAEIIPSTDFKNNNLYDYALIGAWVLQEDFEEGEEKPMSAMCFFENGECYNYYYSKYFYYGIYPYYVSKNYISNWYTNDKMSLMINNGKLFKYSINNDILTITDADKDESTQIFIKINENLVDIINENEKRLFEFETNLKNSIDLDIEY